MTSIEPAQISAGDAVDVNVSFATTATDDTVSIAPGGPTLASDTVLGEVRDAALTSSRSFFLTTDGKIQVLNLDTGIVDTLTLPTQATYTRIFVFSNLLFVSDVDGFMTVFDLSLEDNLTELSRWTLGAPVLDAASWNKHVALLLRNGTLLLFDIGISNTLTLLGQEKVLGDAQSLAYNGQAFFIALGESGLLVLDATESTRFKPLARYATTSPALDVELAGTYAFIGAAHGGLIVLDVSEPINPRWYSSHSKLGYVADLYVSGSRVVATNHASTAFILDTRMARFPNISHVIRLKGTVLQTLLAENRFFAATSNRFQQWSLHNAPAVTNENFNVGEGVNFGGQRRGFIDSQSNLLYVADWFSGLHIYSIAQPTNPRLLGSFHTPGSPKGVVVRDHIAFVADDDHGLQIIDVRQPHDPQLITNFPTAGLAYTPVLENQRLYLASHRGGFQIIDITDIHDLKLLGEFDTPSKAWSIAVQNNTVFVADAEAGLLIFDVSDAAKPNLIGQFNPEGNAEDVLVDGNHAYVAFFDQGLYILDISNPAEPIKLGHLPTPGNARGLTLQGDRLLIADWLAGVHVVDIHDRQRPVLLSTFDTDGAAWGINTKDDQAFVLDWWGGLVVLDITNARDPHLAGLYNQSTTVEKIATRENYLFVAQGRLGLQVFDVKNPLNPTWVTGLEHTGTAHDLVIEGTRAFIAAGDGGLIVVDISNPFQPILLSQTITAIPIESLEMRNSTLFATSSHGDLLWFNIDTPQRPQQLAQLSLASTSIAVHGNTLYSLGRNGLTEITWDSAIPVVQTLRESKVAAGQIVVDETFLYLFENEKGLTLLQPKGSGLEEVGSLMLPEVVLDLYISETTLYVLDAQSLIHVIDVTNASDPRYITRYALSTRATGIVTHKNHVYASGSRSVIAVNRLPKLEQHSVSEGTLNLFSKSSLAEGYYDIVRSRPDGTIDVVENALEVRSRFNINATNTTNDGGTPGPKMSSGNTGPSP